MITKIDIACLEMVREARSTCRMYADIHNCANTWYATDSDMIYKAESDIFFPTCSFSVEQFSMIKQGFHGFKKDDYSDTDSHFLKFFADKNFQNERTIPAKELQSVLKKVFPSISTEETRFYLNGVYFDTERRVVATDGHRLVKCLVSTQLFDLPCIIPRKAIAVLLKKLSDRTIQTVTCLQSDCGTFASFRFQDGSEISARCISASYPGYELIIPKKAPIVGYIGKRELSAILTPLIKSKRSKKDALLVVFDSGEMSHETVDPVRVSFNPPYRIGFNARYLLDMLDSFDGDGITVSGEGRLEPHVFSSPDESHLVVIMPARV